MEESRVAPEVRVLVVDDSVDAATSLGYLLQLMGAKTAVAFGGEMALRLVQLFQPAVVLIDLRMPGLDGCDVMAQARALEHCNPNTLFVCFSASRDPDDRQRCLDAGFDCFLSKPVDPADLAHMLGIAQDRVRHPEHQACAPDADERHQRRSLNERRRRERPGERRGWRP